MRSSGRTTDMRFASILLLLAACGGDDETKEPIRCELAAWRADGDCDSMRVCGFEEPDPGCYLSFDGADAALAWYETTFARKLKGPALPPTDPRFAPTQAIVDDVWRAYQATHPIGTLGDRRFQLVLIENGKPNAFVSGDGSTTKTGLVVLITASLVDLGVPREQLLAIIAHEIEHAIGLHILSSVEDGLQRFYVAGAADEPLGFEQDDDLTARTFALDWIEHARSAGHLSDVELGGLPIEGDLGEAFQAIAEQRGCDLAPLYAAIKARSNPLDRSVSLDAGTTAQIESVMASLRTGCFAGEQDDAIALVADYFDVGASSVRASLPAEYRAGIEGKDFITGIAHWVTLERAALREIEHSFEQAIGLPWSRLRYFSTEEAADDSSVATLRAAGFAGDTLGRVLPALSSIEAECRPLVDANDLSIPYGEDLADDHHGTCWRAGHVKRVAQRATPMRAPVAVPADRPQRVFPRRDDRISH